MNLCYSNRPQGKTTSVGFQTLSDWACLPALLLRDSGYVLQLSVDEVIHILVYADLRLVFIGCNMLVIVLKAHSAHTAVEVVRYWVSESFLIVIVLHDAQIAPAEFNVFAHSLLPELPYACDVLPAVFNLALSRDYVEGRVCIEMQMVQVIG